MRKTFTILSLVVVIGGLAIIFSSIYNSQDKSKINTATNLAVQSVRNVIDLIIKISDLNTFGINGNPSTQLLTGGIDYLEKDVIGAVNNQAEMTNWFGPGKIIDWQTGNEGLTIILTGISGQEHSWTLPIRF